MGFYNRKVTSQNSTMLSSMIRVFALFAMLACASAATKYKAVDGVITVTTPDLKQDGTSVLQAAGTDKVKIVMTTEEDTSSWKSVTMRLCYAPESQKGRKWRKTKDTFEKNTACKQQGLKKIKTMDWPANLKTAEYEFQPDENVAYGIYYVE